MNIYSKQTILKFTIVQQSCIVSVREVRAVDIHAGSSSIVSSMYIISIEISAWQMIVSLSFKSESESEKMSH